MRKLWSGNPGLFLLCFLHLLSNPWQKEGDKELVDDGVCKHRNTYHYTCNTRKQYQNFQQRHCRHVKAQAVTSKGSLQVKTKADIGMELPVIQGAGSIWVYQCVLSDLLRSLRFFWMCLVIWAFGIAVTLLLMDRQSYSHHNCCSCLILSVIKSCFHLIIIYHSIWAKNAYIRDLFLDGFDGKFLQKVLSWAKSNCLTSDWKQLFFFQKALWPPFLSTNWMLLMGEWDVRRKNKGKNFNFHMKIHR